MQKNDTGNVFSPQKLLTLLHSSTCRNYYITISTHLYKSGRVLQRLIESDQSVGGGKDTRVMTPRCDKQTIVRVEDGWQVAEFSAS